MAGEPAEGVAAFADRRPPRSPWRAEQQAPSDGVLPQATAVACSSASTAAFHSAFSARQPSSVRPSRQ